MTVKQALRAFGADVLPKLFETDGGSLRMLLSSFTERGHHCLLYTSFVAFEGRRPTAREIAVVAVLTALAVAARAAFVWVPHFKPMAAIIMIAGIAAGPQTGFLVGSVAALASNFIFGQGPWTPWQMLAFGVVGLVAGLLADARVFPRANLSWPRRVALAVTGFVLKMCIRDRCSRPWRSRAGRWRSPSRCRSR